MIIVVAIFSTKYFTCAKDLRASLAEQNPGYHLAIDLTDHLPKEFSASFLPRF
jgi:hypothetical protein